MNSAAYDPPVTAWDARQQLVLDILASHQAYQPAWLVGRLWVRVRGWRCVAPHCGRRWPCPEAAWAQAELRGHVDGMAK